MPFSNGLCADRPQEFQVSRGGAEQWMVVGDRQAGHAGDVGGLQHCRRGWIVSDMAYMLDFRTMAGSSMLATVAG